MSRTPTLSRGDIELDLAHSAPVVLRARRGPGHEIARVPLVTPVRIRRVPGDAFEPVPVNLADLSGQQEELHAFEGRFWRRALPGIDPSAAAAAFRHRDPEYAVRGEFDDLWLDPARTLPEDGTFMGFHPEMPEGAADRLVLDHARTVASGMARRFAEKVAHDGKGLWIAVDPPLMTAWGSALGERAAAVASRDRVYGGETRRFMASRPVSLRAGHGAVEDVIAWRAAERSATARRRNPNEVDDARLREIAGRLGEQLKGYGDPAADVARYVRTIAAGILPVTDTILNYKTRERPKLAGPPADEIRSRIEALLPHATLAMVDMIPEQDHAPVVERAEGLLRKLEEHLPRTGSYAITYVRAHLTFIRHVVRPRLGGPIPEMDAESLLTLGAR